MSNEDFKVGPGQTDQNEEVHYDHDTIIAYYIHNMQAAAYTYTNQGISVTPVNFMDKKAYLKDWPNRLLSRDDIPRHFNRLVNIGGLTGKASGFLADVDIDINNEEFLSVAKEVLPSTNCRFGRVSKRSSHYLYRVGEDFRTEKYKISDVGEIEIRGSGAQTVLPPSIHESGEPIEWEESGEPAQVGLDELRAACGRLSAIALLSAHFNEANRQDITMAFAGWVSRHDWSEENIIEFIEHVRYIANDDPGDDDKRRDVIRRSIERAARGDKVTGLPTLAKMLGGDVASKIADWLNIESGSVGTTRFFSGKTFIPKRLGDEILQHHHLKFAGDTIWRYHGGVYRPDGEQFVLTEAQRLLGEAVRNNKVNETVAYIKREASTELPEPDPNYINLKNGRLDWKSRVLLPHDPSIFEIVQLPVEYDPDATCPVFDFFLTGTLDAEVIPTVEEMMGYTLVPTTKHEKAFMLVGQGKNGKGVLIDTITGLLGQENCSHVDLQSLSGNRFMAAELVGKLANLHADLDHRALKSSAVFKQLVSGDWMSAERKFGQPFSFRNHAKLIFSANKTPPAADVGYAFFRRWIIIPFTKTFDGAKDDKDLRSKLQRELSGILNRALGGLRRLYDNRMFSNPPQVEAALTEYRLDTDSVAAFIFECIIHAPGGQISKQRLYDSYHGWCEKQGLKAVAYNSFSKQLRRALPGLDDKKPKNGSRFWVDIRLSEDAALLPNSPFSK